MIKKLKYFIIFLFIGIIYSCRSDLDTMGLYNDSQIVVDGILMPGKNPVVRLSWLQELNDTTQKPVSDATVAIYFNYQRYLLDTYDENFGEYSFVDSTLKVLAGETYRLEVEYYGNFLFAQTTIPFPPGNIKLELATDEYVDSLGGDNYSDYLKFSWDSLYNNYYFVAFECDSLSQPDDNYCDYFFPDPFPIQQYYQFMDASGLVSGNAYSVNIYSITEDYALYYYNYDPLASDYGYTGNIENGYGIFTGLNKTNVTFQYFTDSVSILK